jgi:hypothetical protein
MNNINRNTVKWLTVAMIVLAVAVPSFAATTGSLALSGSVAGILSISVSDQGATGLDLSADKTGGVLVASVTEISNKVGGYTVTVSTLNGSGSGKFVGATSGNTDTLTYTIDYAGTAKAFTGNTATLTDTTGKTPRLGTAKALRIFYDGTAGLDPLREDSYTDTLNFTITVK